MNARCVRDLASSPKSDQIAQIPPSSAHPRIRRFLSLTMRGWAPFWRPNLAYGYTFLARQEPKKSCIGNKDLAPFWRFCCGLLILIVKDEEFVLVNHGRTVITFTPGSHVLYIPKNRLWGPKNGPGAVSRRPETPRNSRTLRDRSRRAFFVIVNAPGPMPFFGPFNACVLSVILMNLYAFRGLSFSTRKSCRHTTPSSSGH